MECGTSQLLLVTFVLVSFGELAVARTRAVLAHFQVCDVISSVAATIQSSTDQGVLDHEDNNLNLIIVTPPKLRPG